MLGMDSEEGKFIMVTFWLIEAISRVGFLTPKVIVRLSEEQSKLMLHISNRHQGRECI